MVATNPTLPAPPNPHREQAPPARMNRKNVKRDYAMELAIARMITIKNSMLIAATAATVLELYGMSGSWHSLWAVGMLLFLSETEFVRD